MNKIFTFHFKLGFKYAGSPMLHRWQWLINLVAFLPSGIIFGLDKRHLTDANWKDVPIVLLYWVFFAFAVPFLFGLVVGLVYGLFKLYQFRGYQTIDMAPGYRVLYLTRAQREFRQYCADHIPKSKERIIASANLHKDGSLWAVLSPGRHHHCHWAAHENGGSDRTVQQMGFLTNKFRFLGRQDARKLAMENGQCVKPDHSRDLFSEDLWRTPQHLRYIDPQ